MEPIWLVLARLSGVKLAIPLFPGPIFSVRSPFVPYRGGCRCGRRVCIQLSGPGPDRRLSAVRELVGVGGVVASLSVTSDLTRGHPPGDAMQDGLVGWGSEGQTAVVPIPYSDVYY